jgi:hypothetical protein
MDNGMLPVGASDGWQLTRAVRFGLLTEDTAQSNVCEQGQSKTGGRQQMRAAALLLRTLKPTGGKSSTLKRYVQVLY